MSIVKEYFAGLKSTIDVLDEAPINTAVQALHTARLNEKANICHG